MFLLGAQFGLEQGRSQGWQAGFDKGWLQGWPEGRVAGIEEGWPQGWERGWSDGVDADSARYYTPLSDPPTRQEKLAFLEFARDNHQFYVDHPELTNGFTGTPADSLRWVRLYDALILDYK